MGEPLAAAGEHLTNMLAALFLALLILYGWWAPSSWLGRGLQDVSAALSRRLARARPQAVLAFAVFAALLLGLLIYAKSEGVFLVGPLATEGISYLAAIDVGTALEAAALAWLLRTTGIGRGVWRAARRLAARGRAIMEFNGDNTL